ncbi:MAG: oxygen-independent coproporphyrinogen III oxidase [Deltaproteobacteria bacterium]|nr:oxygen-independent coproporphyrinogen III oxidase [Deltaproteobacteria bacterium]
MSSAALLRRYGTATVPRYTSYPPANLWGPSDADFARTTLARAGSRPLSLYVHVPFCHKLCLYCGCNMLVTKSQALVERYLAALEVEIERTTALLGARAPVVQVHLGGGTPTYLNEAQLARVMAAIDRSLSRVRACETSIEVHPPVTTVAQLATLRALGFSRLSMGVQDFDPDVQARIRRTQPFEQTRDLFIAARQLGFRSISVDLMYGLPLQTLASFERTLDLVAELRPDRLALFGYAHMPVLKKHQAVLTPDLPGPALRLALFQLATEHLAARGYEHVGLDHFALPEDELCRARKDRTLRRNFMGYTTCAASDVLAFGPSAIGEIDGDLLQNARGVLEWAQRIESSALPAVRGWRSSADDVRRREIIHRLFCELEVDRDFAMPMLGDNAPMLAALISDGLVELDDVKLRVTPLGRSYLRNVAVVFDAYFAAGPPRTYSVAV